MATTSLKLILANTISPNCPTIKLLKNWITLNVSCHHHLLTQFAHSNLQQTMGQFTSNTKSSIAALQTNFHNYRDQWESASTWATTSMRTMAQPHESVQWDYHFFQKKSHYRFNWTICSTYQLEQPRDGDKEQINSSRSVSHLPLSNMHKKRIWQFITMFVSIFLQKIFSS